MICSSVKRDPFITASYSGRTLPKTGGVCGAQVIGNIEPVQSDRQEQGVEMVEHDPSPRHCHRNATSARRRHGRSSGQHLGRTCLPQCLSCSPPAAEALTPPPNRSPTRRRCKSTARSRAALDSGPLSGRSTKQPRRASFRQQRRSRPFSTLPAVVLLRTHISRNSGEAPGRARTTYGCRQRGPPQHCHVGQRPVTTTCGSKLSVKGFADIDDPGRVFRFKAITIFVEKHKPKYPKAAECLTWDRGALLALFDFPAEQWDHLRTKKPNRTRIRDGAAPNCPDQGRWKTRTG